MQGSGRAREPKTPYRPVVKFRDMDDDLLRSIAVAEGSSQDADPPHGDESDSADDDEHQGVAADFAFEGADWMTDDEVS